MNHVELLYGRYFEAGNEALAATLAFIQTSETDSSVQELDAALRGYHAAFGVLPAFSDAFMAAPFGVRLRSRLFLEAGDDLTTSVVAASGGFYKSACHALRSFVEMAFLGLYFGEKEDSGERWFAHAEFTPSFKNKILPTVLENPRLAQIEGALDFQSRARTLYDDLSAFTHTRGLAAGYVALPTGFSIRRNSVGWFDKELFHVWAGWCVEAIRTVTIALVATFPNALLELPISDKFRADEEPIELEEPMTGILRLSDVHYLRAMFTPETLSVLQGISDQDQSVQQIKVWMESLPDVR
ncbi:MAG TPA: hypothetical protein VJB57_20525 [Dehalococcoidia bacterium]|nr:hypothetical protein [Dehalococcoidia bacterium]